ncbi:AAA family ATPase [Halorubrum lipolyticum]|uniref:ATPase AAA n=1 Tax=Halorubrum lipolyticum DSM 21995 TaxID=1227482 RepID=M0P4J3_9EURY|nr:AAA family ATPase [Halorubrum lipolyticum]EMA64738.1 ATPase AAA [Halorubrum lipolyticum DSM 21995]
MKDNQGMWDTYLRTGRVFIGYGNTHADLTDAGSRDEVVATCDVAEDDENQKRFGYLNRFVNDLEIGDIIIATRKRDKLLGMGVVTSEYQYEDPPQVGDKNDTHVREIKWLLDFENRDRSTDSDLTLQAPVTVDKASRHNIGTGPFKAEPYSSYVDDILTDFDDATTRSALQTVESLATLYAVGPHPETEPYAEIYGTRGKNDSFAKNLEKTVMNPLDDDTIGEITECFEAHDEPHPKANTFEQFDVTMWAVPKKHNEKYQGLDSGDWVFHTLDRPGQQDIVAIQRVDYPLSNFSIELREDLGELLHGASGFRNIWLSTTPVVMVSATVDDLESVLEALGEDDPDYLSGFDYFAHLPTEHYTQLESSTAFLGEVLTNSAPTDDLPAWPINDLPEIREDDDFFIFITSQNNHYHDRYRAYPFRKGIAGSKQVRDAGEDAVIIHLDLTQGKNGLYRGAGRISDVVEVGEEDGDPLLEARIENYTELTPIPRDMVDDLSVDTGRGQGIIKIEREDYEHISTAEPRSGGPNLAVTDTASSVAALDEDSRYDHPLYKEALAHLVAGRNLVFFGPPGTGKTRAARKLSEVICGTGEDDVLLRTANAEWSNYEVAGGYAPKQSANSDEKVGTDDAEPTSNLAWQSKPGVLAEAAMACQDSLELTGTPSWLIIDELNRANLDQAFGEVFTLLDIDYRDREPITYGDDEAYLPFAFRILATMNSQDQAQLFSLGYAFRRRFGFVEVPSLLRSSTTTTDLPEADTVAAQAALDAVDNEADDMLAFVIDKAKGSMDTSNDGVEYADPAAIFPGIAQSDRVQEVVDHLQAQDLAPANLEASSFELLVALASYITNEEIVEVGHSLVMDASRFVIAYGLLYQDDVDIGTVDRAATSYFVPQVEDFLATIRREETLGGNSNAGSRYQNLIRLCCGLGLDGTAAALQTAKHNEQFLG